jgi:amino acid permease
MTKPDGGDEVTAVSEEPSAGMAGLTKEDAGYHKSLKPRQLQMIAIGGAIGTGLFLGAGGRLASAGPGLFLIYGISCSTASSRTRPSRSC